MNHTRVLIDGESVQHVNAFDRGLHYGDGVFRTLKVVAGEIRWWPDQYRKLADDCAALGIPCSDPLVLAADVQRLAEDPALGAIKIIITRGAGRRGYAMPENATATRLVMGFPFPAHENLAVRVRWCDLRLSSQPRLAGIKHTNRLENVLARSEWRDESIAEGLLRDEAGNVICATASNLLIVEQGRLFTPDLSRCGIAGVTRERIMRASQQHGLRVQTEPISPERLIAAEGVFLCNSLIEVWRVAALEQQRWPDDGWAETLRNWLRS